MTDDSRCCGTGTCLINADGFCWCGQRWDGEKMCFPDKKAEVELATSIAKPAAPQPSPNPPSRSS